MTRPSVGTTLDLVEMVDHMVGAAAAVTTGRLSLADPADARFHIVRGDPDALAYFRFELARQVAGVLVWLEPQVTAVFEEQTAPPGEELEPEPPTHTEPLRLIVQVESEPPTLRSVIDALNEAFRQVMFDVLPLPPGGLLRAVIVDADMAHLLRASAYGYRPAPLLLASRANTLAEDWRD
jgi:hypothetical protein